MKKPYGYNIIVGLVVMSLIFAPALFLLTKPQQAEAAIDFQITGGNYGTTNMNSGNYADYKFNVSNIMDSGLLSSVLGCTGITDKLTKALDNLFTKASNKVKDKVNNISGNAVPISSAALDAIAASAKSTDKTLTADQKREECFKGLAISLARKQLADTVEKTVNWINSGYNGEAFFVKDPDSFYTNLRNQTMTDLLNPFTSDPAKYPFGKDFARSQIINARNLTQSILTSRLGTPTATYNKSFLSGGWSEWLNITQNPGNNPLGFASMAQDYITQTIDNKILATDKELQQGNGFLSQKRCVLYDKTATQSFGILKSDANGASNADRAEDNKGVCVKYEIVTPGSMIASKASNALNSPERQLEMTNDINSSLKSIFSALVDSLMTWGLSGLETTSYANPDNTIFTNDQINTVSDVNGNDISGTYYGSDGQIIKVNMGSGWSSANGKPFKIETDLVNNCVGPNITDGSNPNKGIIGIQEDYKLAVKDSLSSMKPIMPALGALDYCIPGPNPGWEQSTRMTLNATISYYQDIYLDQKGAPVLPNPQDYQSEYTDQAAPWTQLNIPNISADLSTAFKSNGLEDFENRNSWLYSLDAIGLTSTVDSIICMFTDCTSNTQRQAEAQARADAALARAQDEFDFTIKNMVSNLKTKFENYSKLIEQDYGYSSPMLKQDYYGLNDDGSPKSNKQYLEMGITGLDITKNIGVYALNIDEATKEYNELLNQATSNIYQLNQIQKQIDKIVAAAKARQVGTLAYQEMLLNRPAGCVSYILDKTTNPLKPVCKEVKTPGPLTPNTGGNGTNGGVIGPGPGVVHRTVDVTQTGSGSTGTATGGGSTNF